MNGDVTIQELTNLIGQNAQTVSDLTRAVGDLSYRFMRVEDSVKNVTKDITDIKGDIVDIKANEEITFSQQQAIQTAVHSRVYQLLGVPIKKSDRTVGDAVTVNRYSQLFHSRCYREVMNKGHLFQPYRTTPKKYFSDAIMDIEAWCPREGVQALKDEADKDALAKRIAKKQGYM